MKKMFLGIFGILFLSSCVWEIFPKWCENNMEKIQESSYYNCNWDVYFQKRENLFEQERITYKNIWVKTENFAILPSGAWTDGKNLFSWWEKWSTFDINSYEVRNWLAIDKNYIYFWNERSFKIDKNSFETFENEKWEVIFAKDKNNVFLISWLKYSRILKWINSKSFNYIWWTSFKDKKGLYHIGWHISSEYEKIWWNFNLETIEYIKWDYYKDKNNIYKYSYINQKLETTDEKFDFESFWSELKHIWWNYFKDNWNIYYRKSYANILVEADYKTFEYLKDDFAKDKNWLFREENLIARWEVKPLLGWKYYEIRQENSLKILFLKEERMKDIYEQDLGKKIHTIFLDFDIYNYARERVEIIWDNLRIWHLDIKNGSIFFVDNEVFGWYYFNKKTNKLHCLDDFYKTIELNESDKKYLSTRIYWNYFSFHDRWTYWKCEKISENSSEIYWNWYAYDENNLFYNWKIIANSGWQILKDEIWNIRYILLKNRDLVKNGEILKWPFYFTEENKLHFWNPLKWYIIWNNDVYDTDFNIILKNIWEIKYLYNNRTNKQENTQNNFFIDKNWNIYDKNFKKLDKNDLKNLSKEEKEEIEKLKKL